VVFVSFTMSIGRKPEREVRQHTSSDISFRDLAVVGKRRWKNHAIAISEASIPNLKSERQVFNLVKVGGLQQGESDIAG